MAAFNLNHIRVENTHTYSPHRECVRGRACAPRRAAAQRGSFRRFSFLTSADLIDLGAPGENRAPLRSAVIKNKRVPERTPHRRDLDTWAANTHSRLRSAHLAARSSLTARRQRVSARLFVRRSRSVRGAAPRLNFTFSPYFYRRLSRSLKSLAAL